MGANKTYQTYALAFGGKAARRQIGRATGKRRAGAKGGGKPTQALEMIPGYLTVPLKFQAA